METTTNNMQEFRNATKNKRGKGRPKLTEEEKMRRIRAKAIRLSHINAVTSERGLLLIKTKVDDRDCFKWSGGNGEVQKKLDKIDQTELVIFTSKLSKFTFDEWTGDFERAMEVML
jgi:hypothetical protein